MRGFTARAPVLMLPHIGAALYHHIKLKDNTLKCMSLRK